MLLNLLEKTLEVCFAVIPRDKPSLDMMQSVRFVAHRGAHNHAQGIIENTLEAMRLAKESGCFGVEFDVRATADKILVVNHDATLKRLWGHSLTIADLTFRELRALVPGIPSLDEVVAAFGQSVHLFIELKAPFHDEDALVKALKGLSAGTNYHLLSLDVGIFRSMSQFPRNALLLVAAHNNVEEFCTISQNEHYGGVLGHYFLISKKTINKMKAADQVIGVGQIDSKYSMYRELNRGINLLFTNRAAEIQVYLDHPASSYRSS